MSTPASAISPSASPADASGARSLRILLVEDNLDLRQLVCELLYNLGHTPTPAGSAEEALAQLDAGASFDTLLSDVSLPGMSGVDLARHAVAILPGIHIIFASGYGSALTANVDFPAHSLTKPYDIDHLHQLLVSLGPANKPFAPLT